MSLWWWLLLWPALAVPLSLGLGKAIRLRDEREAPRPHFVFGDGPLAGVSLGTTRPWVHR